MRYRRLRRNRICDLILGRNLATLRVGYQGAKTPRTVHSSVEGSGKPHKDSISVVIRRGQNNGGLVRLNA